MLQESAYWVQPYVTIPGTKSWMALNMAYIFPRLADPIVLTPP